MTDLEMIRDLTLPIQDIAIPSGYSIISVNEDNGYLWDEVMDSSWGYHPPGAFRFAVVSNNGYEDDRVFLLLDENKKPIATCSPWHYGTDHWYQECLPGVIFVGVAKPYEGKGYGRLMTNHSLHELKKRGYHTAYIGGVKGTGDGENYSAVKTYLNCGFVPCVVEEEHIGAWMKVYEHLELPAPKLEYKKPAYPEIKMPHPPRPWPYQMRCALEARNNGDVYVFGVWDRHNMYLVDPERYIQLKALIHQSGNADSIIPCILSEQVKNIYINHPRNPKAFLLIKKDGSVIRFNLEADALFAQGVKTYLA